ncbi:MAG TPA: AMP-binding protein [Crenalkalicoccus sp.]|jgi:acyl-CoA synthetase (AMP-forming)/AMP-acid ligase II|nr:AMP-binding protein [Crenalkalicoccus sp.]
MSMNEAEYLDRLRALWAKNWPAGVPREPRYPLGEIPLSEYLRERARRTPAKPAVIFYGTELSYGELDRLSDRFAALLASEGVSKGDRVAVFLPTCLQFHIAFYGILKLGAVHVPVNPMFREHELLHELEDTGAEVMVAQDQLMPLVRQVLPRTKLRRVFVTSVAETLPEAPAIPVPEGVAAPRIACPDAVDLLPALEACTAPVPRTVPGLDDVAALNYTGGTTGLPKGCIHTQRDMIYTAATVCGRHASAEAAEQEVSLSFYQLFWIAGENTGLIVPVFCGSTLVELSRWDPVGWMAAVERYKVTSAGMLVDNAVAIMDHPDVARYDLRSLRRTGVSSFVKKLNTDYRRRWEALTGVTMAESAWGMTETHTHDTFTTGMQADDWDLKQQPIFVGLPVPGTEFKICSFETGEILPLGAEGEIVVRSPSQLKGYWNKSEATAASIRDGWFHTGDIGVLDEGGYLHFLGRRKEMLKVTGMSVFPAEIEAMLGRHPAVVGSGVVGRPDEKRGQVPVAFVLLAEAAQGRLTEAELAAWCRANMATYKVPEIRFVDSLPMTATGKVKKEELAKQHFA